MGTNNLILSISRNQAQNHCPSVQGAEAEHHELQGKATPEKRQVLDEALASINPGHGPWPQM